jgi:hypothetical protein
LLPVAVVAELARVRVGAWLPEVWRLRLGVAILKNVAVVFALKGNAVKDFMLLSPSAP